MTDLVHVETGEILDAPQIPDPGMPISANDLLRIERHVAEVVRQVDDFDLIDDWRRKARALEHYLKGKEMKSPMAGAQRMCEARIGELLGPVEKERQRTDLTVGHNLQSIDRADRQDFRLLANGFDKVPLAPEEWRKSRKGLLAHLRKELGMLPETPPLPEGTFACITADPPWRLDTGEASWGGAGDAAGHDALEYDQMSVDDISALPIADLAAPDAHLYLWTTNRYVEHAYAVARAWGFNTPGTMLVWCKAPRGVGLGDAYRLTTEFVLHCRRGALPALDTVPTTWFEWPRGRHSEKPDDFYQMVETVSPGPFCELFAREARDGWSVWGNEVTP